MASQDSFQETMLNQSCITLTKEIIQKKEGKPPQMMELSF